MKKTILGIVGLWLLASCSQVAGVGSNSDSTNINGADSSTAMLRDESINEGNAYSDLFLDSASLEKYIATEKPADSIAAMMRSFYGRRNYQFAWFATNGLTEQARGLW